MGTGKMPGNNTEASLPRGPVGTMRNQVDSASPSPPVLISIRMVLDLHDLRLLRLNDLASGKVLGMARSDKAFPLV